MNEEECAFCSDVLEKMSVCSRCKSVCYCGRDCQAKHWKMHKLECHPPELEIQAGEIFKLVQKSQKYRDEGENEKAVKCARLAKKCMTDFGESKFPAHHRSKLDHLLIINIFALVLENDDKQLFEELISLYNRLVALFPEEITNMKEEKIYGMLMGKVGYSYAKLRMVKESEASFLSAIEYCKTKDDLEGMAVNYLRLARLLTVYKGYENSNAEESYHQSYDLLLKASENNSNCFVAQIYLLEDLVKLYFQKKDKEKAEYYLKPLDSILSSISENVYREKYRGLIFVTLVKLGILYFFEQRESKNEGTVVKKMKGMVKIGFEVKKNITTLEEATILRKIDNFVGDEEKLKDIMEGAKRESLKDIMEGDLMDLLKIKLEF